MDFLFAPLPATNFEMNAQQLRLWQRNAYFECDCDNFINHHIETSRFQMPNVLRRPRVEETAIDAAIQNHGVSLRNENQHDYSREYSNNHRENPLNRTYTILNYSPLRQRRRLDTVNAETEVDEIFERLNQESYTMTIRTQGLNVRNS